jgi:D-Tyr-tRNAtyr deacylase
MRFLVLHVDYFKSEITEKGRSPVVEPFEERVTEVSDGLVVLVSVEKGDEARPEEVAERAAAELADIAGRVGATRLVLHSFAHLFAELARPTDAVPILQATAEQLRERGLDVVRTPFGWFNTLEIRAKGHPLSRVARIVRP